MPRFKIKRRRKEQKTETGGQQAMEKPPSAQQLRWSGNMAAADPAYKIILCGEYGVGKSSIFRRFLNDTFTSDSGQQASMGLDQCTKHILVGSTTVKLTLWDTGGMERMSFIGASYYRGAQAALLCYNSNNKDTFSILSQYILDIAMNAEGAKIFVCGNDALGEGKEPVEDGDMDSFMAECGDMLSGVYTISCRQNTGLDAMFRDMATVLHADAINRHTLSSRDMIRPGQDPQPQGDGTDGQKNRGCC